MKGRGPVNNNNNINVLSYTQAAIKSTRCVVMNENEHIRQKIEALGLKSTTAFIKSINSCISRETWRRVIKLDEQVDIRTLLIMAGELQISPHVLRSILISRREFIIADWITPGQIGPNEEKMLEKFRKLDGDPEKTKLVLDMVEYLGKPAECEACRGKDTRDKKA